MNDLNFNLKPQSLEDKPRVADLFNAHSMAITGTGRALIDADGDLRTARYISAAAEQWILSVKDNSIVGHAFVLSKPPHVVVEFGITLHPDLHAAEWGRALLDHVEASTLNMTHRFPIGARVVLQTTVLEHDTTMQGLLARAGYVRQREWVHYELTVAERPVVELPDGVTIRVMNPRVDWPAVGAVMDAAFADHWGEMGAQARTLMEPDETAEEPEDASEEEMEDDPYSNSLGLCFVAETNGEVIGSCLCNERTIEWRDSGKLGSLGVRREYRRLGVGQALTATALAEFHRRGIRRVITDTDNASFTGANRLYPRFGFRPYRYEHVFEKELRPGIEWRALTPDDLIA